MKFSRFALVSIALSLLAHGADAQGITTSDNLPTGITIEKDSPAQLSRSETAARIIALHLKAAGGEEAWNALKTMQAEAKVEDSRRSFDVTFSYATPDQFRGEYRGDDQGWRYQHTLAFDGTSGWRQEALPKPGSVTSLSLPDAENLRRQALLFNPFSHAEAKGNVFAFLGKTDVFNTPAYLVRATLQANSQRPFEAFYYFDAKTFLVLNIGYKEYHTGREVDVDRHTTRMLKIDGLWLPVSYELRSEGTVLRRVSFGQVTLNPELPEAYFSAESDAGAMDSKESGR